MRIVMDIETDGLLENVSKIHCLSYLNIDVQDCDIITLTDYDQMRELLLQDNLEICGHNIIRYDIPVLEKILNIKINAKLIDTLGLSWYLYPSEIKHGLEQWGEKLGVEKPKIKDWSNLRLKDYIHRCESDVEINKLLFLKQLNYLAILYSSDLVQINNLINYLGFKLDCAREQEEVGCKINLDLVNESLQELYSLKNEKIRTLVEAMPKYITYKEVTKPNKTHKINGELSNAGIKWFNLLADEGLPQDYEGVVTVKVSEEDGNPASTTQLKSWLDSLGWEPRTFEYRKNTAGEIKAIPQIYVDDQVCDSIKDLYTVEPALESLDMLSLINHRIGVFETIKNLTNSDNYIKAEIGGFTNTLRFKHRKPIANLPKVFKFYGDKIRGAIISPDENSILCGSDMSSLEDTTKQHYMYFFDPEYVTQMRVPGFDPHLDIAVLAGMLTPEQSEQHKRKEVDYSQIRNKAKTVNFAGVYGAGPPKIALTTGMPLQQAQKLHKTYWDRNKAVKQVAKSAKTKTTIVDGIEQMWLFNPVSRFWYSLRFEKDKFSTLNQGTGTYVFDLWVREVRLSGIKIMFQYHDEIAFHLKEFEQDIVKKKLLDSIEKVNKTVKLNVPLGVSVDFGKTYADVH